MIKLADDKQFLMFWAAWKVHVPHRGARGPAHKEWWSLTKKLSEAEIEEFRFKCVGAIESQSKAKKKEHAEKGWHADFPDPHRWLHNERYDDEKQSQQERERIQEGTKKT